MSTTPAVAADFSAFADLSGVVLSLTKDLEGKVLSQTDLIKYLPKFVSAAWAKGLTLEKAEAQILAAIKHLISKYVPEAQRSAAISFVDSEFPVLVKVLNGFVDEVKAAVEAKAAAFLTEAGNKVQVFCSNSCLPIFSGLLGGVKQAPAVAAPVEAALPKTPSAIEEVAAAAASDLASALSPVEEKEEEAETEAAAPATSS